MATILAFQPADTRRRREPQVTITRLSERGTLLAMPAARPLTIEEELEAEIAAFETTSKRAEALLQQTAAGALIAAIGTTAAAAAALFILLWLATRIATGV